MKIRLETPGQGKVRANVWVNDDEYTVESGTTLDLRVKKSDTVRYRVGKIGIKKAIDFQSVGAKFEISPNRNVQFISVLMLLALLLGMWYFTGAKGNNVWLTVGAVALLAVYFAANMLAGYKAVPVHTNDDL